MTPSPRLLLTIDYESWFAPSRRYDFLPPETRFQLDEGISRQAIDPILEILGDAKATFYLVGEMVGWYPELPEKIIQAGHEVGFHCHIHRRLNDIKEIEKDLTASAEWIQKHNVRGYRAPMINTVEEVYPLLEKHNFIYSSSLYAPAGTAIKKGGVWEIPVSTLPLLKRPTEFFAPRYMNLKLVRGGEFPYGSSFMSGLFRPLVYKIIERELKAGRSPVIFLHPYEIVTPAGYPQRFIVDMLHHPLLFPFTFNKSKFLKELLRNFPTSTMQDYIKELQ
ncbi:MAG: polysaccharide deacetylase family protein [Anaerolineales bacterium]|nr:polysaccharide deacetylase family protein [Anaerolineales bacterium]MCB9112378.1 polysaccharide deacetylase family protein [Anaerolineales bacterium]